MLALITAALAVIKLAGFADISWLVVVAPILLQFAIIIGVFVLTIITIALGNK